MTIMRPRIPRLPIPRMTPRPSDVDPPGLAARRIAADILDGVLRRRRPLDEQLDDRAAHPDFAALADRDRALVRALATRCCAGSARCGISSAVGSLRGFPPTRRGSKPRC